MAVEYNQHTWGYGEELTPDKLNNIEGGVKATADAVNEVNNNLAKKQPNLSYGKFTGNIDNINGDGSNGYLRENSVVWIHNTEASGGQPIGVEYYILETLCVTLGIIVQRATQYIYQGAPQVYTRMFVNDAWSPEWAKL